MAAVRAAPAAALIALAAALLAPAAARAECPSADASYFGPCGPTFTTPMWGDGAGWTDESKFSTIRLADVNGDGRDELLGRGDAGIEIWTFDTTVGQWRPQVDGNEVRQVISDFASPGPGADTLGWRQPSHYATIQTANVDGRPGEEVFARFPDGVRAYRYEPPAGGNSIDGGTWKLLAAQGPYPDIWGWGAPQYYLTVRSVLGGGGSNAISHQGAGLVSYRWVGGWQFSSSTPTLKGCESAACFLTMQVLPGGAGFSAADPANSLGQSVWNLAAGQSAWQRLPVTGRYGSGPLSGNRASPDCPLVASLCFPELPWLYGTVRWADLAPQISRLPQLVALTPKGLVAYAAIPGGKGSGSIAWEALPTLTDLAYPLSAWASNPGTGGSLTIADLDGDGHDEVLALQNGQLRAWTYDATSRAWTELKPTTPLNLDDETVWSRESSHYATFRAGDVDGDGREEIIARGPYGIRTWFYDRRGSGGWERYLPEGYPAFTGGEGKAFAKLTELAKQDNVIAPGASSVREVWTLENPPDPSDLSALQTGVLSIARCQGLQPGEPPRYQTCEPPGGADFTAAEWTAVINEVVSEIFAAGQVLAHFGDLEAMRKSLFIAENAAFPAIGSDLGLQAAADSTVPYEQNEYWAGFMQIVGSLVGLAEPEAGAALSVGGDIASMVPSSTPSIMSTYKTDYAGLASAFASSVSEADKATAELSQTVRQDFGLLTLVAQLRERGTWRPDLVGIDSAAQEAFAGWVYKSLLPSIYDVYDVSHCVEGELYDGNYCDPPSTHPSYPGVIGSADGPSFTTLSTPHQTSWSGIETAPCADYFSGLKHCHYSPPPEKLANLVFGAVSPQCDYVPGEAGTAWTFGCNLGLSPEATIGPLGPANGWKFNTYTAEPTCNCNPPQVAVQPVGRKATVRTAEVIRVPRGFRLARARATATRMLFEPGGGELAAPGRPASRPADRARGTRRAVRPRTVTRLSRLGPRLVRVAVRTRGEGLRVPPACQALPPSAQPRDAVARLETRLRLSDGRRTITRTIRRDWRCERDRTGRVVRLRAVKRPRVHRFPQRLRITIALPRSVEPGRTAVVRMRVRNPHRPGPRATVWHAAVAYRAHLDGVRGGASEKRIPRLGPGAARGFDFRVQVPRRARGRLCVVTVATADLTRAATNRACTRIHSPRGAR